MQAQVDIEFDQLVQIARKLPAQQWTKLKEEVETPSSIETESILNALTVLTS